ncbi:MAG: zinc ribbon domain-containing protein [bacterium]|nr:zinc ribbon domain-containing protein [bacterium]
MRTQRGFTVIELMVVVLLLSVIAFCTTLALPSAPRRDPELPVPASDTEVFVKLTGLAVLLFGAGFWYLVELRSPGRLDRFRLGQFLLLALTYSLFFAAFAVLRSHDVSAWLAVGIAAAVSYPLTGLHVATIVDHRFAWTAAAPLAAFTTAIVVVAVYGDGWRPFCYLGMTCATIAFLTLTYPGLVRAHDRRRNTLEGQLTQAITELHAPSTNARHAITSTRSLLATEDAVEHETLRDWVSQRLTALEGLLCNHELAVEHHDRMRSQEHRRERRESRSLAESYAGPLATRLPQACVALDEAAAALAAERRAARTPAPVPTSATASTTAHCIACGHACGPEARFCPSCGTTCATLRNCRECGDVLRLPRHLLAPGTGESLPTTHCFGCGERHAG